MTSSTPPRPKLSLESRYRLLRQISLQQYDTLDLDEILNHLLDTVQTIVEYDAAGIFVLQHDLKDPESGYKKQMIAGVARRGFDERPVDQDPMLTMGKGIVGHVIRSGEPAVAPDVSRDPRYVVGREGTRAEIAVPIMSNGRAIGALNLESDTTGSFSDADLEALSFFADTAAIAIEKGILHRQILEKERLEEQLRIAREVQSRLLPEQSPRVRGYDIAGVCLPTYQIGGDSFDYISRADGKVGVFVADVSGKGVPAALIMAAFRALLRAYARRESDLAHLARRVNRQLLESTAKRDFVSCLYGILDPIAASFTYVNCGHNPPLLVRAGGTAEALGNGNLILGIFEDARFTTGEIGLAEGDALILYTDGVVECEDATGGAFGLERLASVVRRSGPTSALQVTSAIVQEAQALRGTEHFEDDFTLVVIKKRNEEEGGKV